MLKMKCPGYNAVIQAPGIIVKENEKHFNRLFYNKSIPQKELNKIKGMVQEDRIGGADCPACSMMGSAILFAVQKELNKIKGMVQEDRIGDTDCPACSMMRAAILFAVQKELNKIKGMVQEDRIGGADCPACSMMGL